MAKNEKFNEEDGVWRTIGGRRVFIRNGQSLSDAMKESGKFSRVAKNQELYKKVEEENKKDHTFKMNDEEKKKYEEVGKKIDDLTKEIDKEKEAGVWEKQPDGTFLANKDAMKKQYEENHKNYDAKIKQFAEDRKNMTNGDWEGMLMAYEQQNADGTYKTLQDIMDDVDKYEKETKNDINSESKFMEKRRKEIEYERENGIYDGERHTDENGHYKYQKELDEKEKTTNWQDQIKANNAKLEKDLQAFQEKHKNDMTNEKVQEEYYEMFRKNERTNAKIKAEHNEPNDKYMNVDAYAGYKDKFNQTWGEDGQGEKTVSAKMYTNDEFMEHLEDANWHSERKALLDANLTNKELEYIKDRTKVSAWGVENLTGKEQVDKLIKEAKSQSANQSMNDAIREKASKKTNSQFEVSDLKAKALASLPKEHIDTHGSDLYIKKTKESDALLENMKNKNSGLLTTFKDQQTGETWYDVPFGNMGDDFKEKASGDPNKADVSYKTFLGKLTKGENEGKNYVEWKASQREKASKRVAEADIKEKGYEYYSRHGLGPGTLPKDVNTGGTGENENGWTKFKTDRPLTSEELKKYDIQSETRNSEIKSNNDRMNDILREKAYKKYLKEHPGSKLSFEDFKDMRKQ